MANDDALEFARLAAALQAAPTPSATADDIVRYVQQEFDADHASITIIRRRDQLETIAPTDRVAEQLDHEQYRLGEGPCYDSSWHGQTLTSTNLAEDERWPRWTVRATALGVASAAAAELNSIEDRRIGSINVFWNQPRPITPDDADFMSIFAWHAAVALQDAWKEEALNVALDSRKLIGQAQGILMERYDLDETQAFQVLRRFSQDQNLKLGDVAGYLTANRQLPSSNGTSTGQR